MLVDATGTVALTDFGLSTTVFSGSSAGPRGSPAYMSTSLYRGKNPSVATDVWALGCSVMEMATGCVPWKGKYENWQQIAYALQSRGATPLRALKELQQTGKTSMLPEVEAASMSADLEDFIETTFFDELSATPPGPEGGPPACQTKEVDCRILLKHKFLTGHSSRLASSIGIEKKFSSSHIDHGAPLGSDHGQAVLRDLRNFGFADCSIVHQHVVVRKRLLSGPTTMYVKTRKNGSCPYHHGQKLHRLVLSALGPKTPVDLASPYEVSLCIHRAGAGADERFSNASTMRSYPSNFRPAYALLAQLGRTTQARCRLPVEIGTPNISLVPPLLDNPDDNQTIRINAQVINDLVRRERESGVKSSFSFEAEFVHDESLRAEEVYGDKEFSITVRELKHLVGSTYTTTTSAFGVKFLDSLTALIREGRVVPDGDTSHNFSDGEDALAEEDEEDEDEAKERRATAYQNNCTFWSLLRASPLMSLGTEDGSHAKELIDVFEEFRLNFLGSHHPDTPSRASRYNVEQSRHWKEHCLGNTSLQIGSEIRRKVDTWRRMIQANYFEYGFTSSADVKATLDQSLTELCTSICISQKGYFLVEGCWDEEKQAHSYSQLTPKTPIQVVFLHAAGIDFGGKPSVQEQEMPKYFRRRSEAAQSFACGPSALLSAHTPRQQQQQQGGGGGGGGQRGFTHSQPLYTGEGRPRGGSVTPCQAGAPDVAAAGGVGVGGGGGAGVGFSVDAPPSDPAPGRGGYGEKASSGGQPSDRESGGVTDTDATTPGASTHTHTHTHTSANSNAACVVTDADKNSNDACNGSCGNTDSSTNNNNTNNNGNGIGHPDATIDSRDSSNSGFSKTAPSSCRADPQLLTPPAACDPLPVPARASSLRHSTGGSSRAATPPQGGGRLQPGAGSNTCSALSMSTSCSSVSLSTGLPTASRKSRSLSVGGFDWVGFLPLGEFRLCQRIKENYRAIYQCAKRQRVRHMSMLPMGQGVFLNGIASAEDKDAVRKAYFRAQFELLCQQSWGFDTYYLNAGGPHGLKLAEDVLSEVLVKPDMALSCNLVFHCCDAKYLAVELAKQSLSAAVLNPSDCSALIWGVTGTQWEMGRYNFYSGEQDMCAHSTAVLAHGNIVWS
ncbi:Mitogen-activated protein kinase kinase kinase 2 [Diplonema papillatum]|nr:Mitogen-activated protein kinase kinase kinase 2 [Diplonema papillatum]